MSDSDDIARYIAEHGVTRCPTVYLEPSQAAPPGKTTTMAPIRYKAHGRGGRYFRTVEQVVERETIKRAS